MSTTTKKINFTLAQSFRFLFRIGRGKNCNDFGWIVWIKIRNKIRRLSRLLCGPVIIAVNKNRLSADYFHNVHENQLTCCSLRMQFVLNAVINFLHHHFHTHSLSIWRFCWFLLQPVVQLLWLFCCWLSFWSVYVISCLVFLLRRSNVSIWWYDCI